MYAPGEAIHIYVAVRSNELRVLLITSNDNIITKQGNERVYILISRRACRAEKNIAVVENQGDVIRMHIRCSIPGYLSRSRPFCFARRAARGKDVSRLLTIVVCSIWRAE